MSKMTVFRISHLPFRLTPRVPGYGWPKCTISGAFRPAKALVSDLIFIALQTIWDWRNGCIGRFVAIYEAAFMKTNSRNPIGTAVCSLAVTLLAGSSLALAQDQPSEPPADTQQTAPAPGVWRKAGSPASNQPADANPRTTMDPNYGRSQAPDPNRQYPNQPAASTYNPGPIPAKLTIKPGTLLTVRLNQALSSDQNQPFSARRLPRTSRMGGRRRRR